MQGYSGAVIVLLLCSALSYGGASVYYVRPTDPPDTRCPSEPCYSLDEYASHYITSNTTLKFLPGVHELHRPFFVRYVSNLDMVIYKDSSSNSQTGSVDIFCHDSFLSFLGVSNLTIAGLTLSNCSTNSCISDSVCGGSLQLHSVTNLTMYEVTVKNGETRGILAKNILGNSLISRSLFSGNSVSKSVSNVAVLFMNDNDAPFQNRLTIADSRFEYGAGGSMFVLILQNEYTVEVDCQNITTVGAGASFSGGDVYFRMDSGVANTIRVTDSTISNSKGVGLIIASTRVRSGGIPSEVSIHNCDIRGHLQGGMALLLLFDAHVIIEDTTIRHNQFNGLFPAAEFSRRGAGLGITSTPIGFTSSNIFPGVALRNVTFEYNSYMGILDTTSAIVWMHYISNITFTDCKFRSNVGTPLLVYNSHIDVSGTMIFENNTAYTGGALTIVTGGIWPGQSIMNIDNHTCLLFQNNSATLVGGAIYIPDAIDRTLHIYDEYLDSLCFFSVVYPAVNISLNFTNDRAHNGGDAIYGGYLDHGMCKNLYSDFLDESFHFDYGPSDLSVVASSPSRVCLCENGVPVCTKVFLSGTHFPGETFSVFVVAVGQRFGAVNAPVHAQLLFTDGTQSVGALGELQLTQGVEHSSCSELKYTIFSDSKTETLILTTSDELINSYLDPQTVSNATETYNSTGDIPTELLSFPVYINITLLSCPMGFSLSGHPGRCDCEPKVEEIGLTCNITSQTVRRSGNVWIGNYNRRGVIVQTNCPFGYCKSDMIDVDPDSQCDFSHSGLLCGGCQPGLSLTLGGSRCLGCKNNDYLAMIIPFAVAGIVLVFFIQTLDLTVSQGTINGLIFYANIVGDGQALFLPPGATNILTGFIAWFNLDLGIQTCFFDGLNAYWKAWLQFTFPLYIWCIAGLIILLCRYSQTAMKIFGRHSVQVLATLVLLSYAKLLRTILNALSFMHLNLPDGSQILVWKLDGNVKYLGPQHAPLFVVALLVLLFLWLPFTLILLFWQWLQKLTHYKLVHWIVERKPFFEAFVGPLRLEHQYWVGVLLLARGLLLLMFIVNSTNAPSVDLLVVGTTAIVLLTYGACLPHSPQGTSPHHTPAQPLLAKLPQLMGSLYRKWYLSLLENSFILNLGILALASYYVRLGTGNKVAAVYTSVGLAFIEFIGIALFHAYFRLKQIWVAVYARNTANFHEELAQYQSIQAPPQVNQIETVDFSRLREPVLDYIDSD